MEATKHSRPSKQHAREAELLPDLFLRKKIPKNQEDTINAHDQAKQPRLSDETSIHRSQTDHIKEGGPTIKVFLAVDSCAARAQLDL